MTQQIWDAHVHLFPPEIYRNWDKYAARDPWFAALTKTPEDGNGTAEAWCDAEEALACADAAGVHGLVMQGWYWNDPGLMTLHNDYMAECVRRHPTRLIAFSSVNPMFGDAALSEVERCVKLGFRGVGELGPGGNGYDFEHPRFFALLELCQALQLPVCIHCGEPVGHPYPGKDTTSLSPLPGVARRFPELKLILAHLGGGLPFYELNPRVHRDLSNVYYDTAANPLLYSIQSISIVTQIIGSGRLLYGSDFPLLLYPRSERSADMTRFLAELRGCGLLDNDLDAILGNNLSQLLSL